MTEMTTTEVAELLAHDRPDRYAAGDLTWADNVIDAVALALDPASARLRTAEQIVRGVERSATGRTNKFMRDIADLGALPLDWIDASSWPLSIGTDRVCLRDLTSLDLRDWADQEEVAATRDHKARLHAVAGARTLADLLDVTGTANVERFAHMQASIP